MLSMYGMQDQYPTLGLAENFLLRLGYQIPSSAPASDRSLLGLARRVLPETLRYEISKHLPSDTQQHFWLPVSPQIPTSPGLARLSYRHRFMSAKSA
jgi:hypothetical protein